MFVPFIAVAVGLLILIVALSVYLERGFRVSLTSVEEKSAGLLFYYRSLLNGVLGPDTGLANWLAALHYVALHLLIPVLGLGLFLRTDGNFFVLIVALIWSIQLLQRLYPGPLLELEDDDLPEDSEDP